MDDDISFESDNDVQDEIHDNTGEITGVEPDDIDHEDDLTYSDEDNMSTVSEVHNEIQSQPNNSARLSNQGRLSPTSVISNIEPAVPVNYPDPDLIAPAAESPRRYPTRNRKQVQRLDPSKSTKESYDHAMIQYLCMSQMAEKEEQKRLSLHKGLRVWGEKGLAAVKAELSQIHFRNVFTPVDPHSNYHTRISLRLWNPICSLRRKGIWIKKAEWWQGVRSRETTHLSKKHPHQHHILRLFLALQL